MVGVGDGSRLAARGSRLAARGSRLAARGSRLAARGSRLAARVARASSSVAEDNASILAPSAMQPTRTSVLLFVLVAGVAGCGVDEQPESSSRASLCERLRDHLIDLRLVDAKHVDLAAHRAAMKQAMGADFLASCGKLDPSEISCSLGAPDTNTASACATRPARADR
jgi:hypothetical protein